MAGGPNLEMPEWETQMGKNWAGVRLEARETQTRREGQIWTRVSGKCKLEQTGPVEIKKSAISAAIRGW